MIMRYLSLLACCALIFGVAPVHAQAGKPNAGLAIMSADAYQLQVGSSQTITVRLSSANQQGLLRLSLTTSSADLELLSPHLYEFDLTENATPELILNVLPHRDGRYYLMLNAEIQRQGQPDQAQAFGVVVRVGQAQTPMRLFKATAAPAVISLPAQETIRPAS